MVYKVPFAMGMSHYDDPPPDHIEDLDGLVAADGVRSCRPGIRRMLQGDLLTREGEPGDDLFLLLDGVLEVEAEDAW